MSKVRKVDADQDFAIIAGGSRQPVPLDDGARGLGCNPEPRGDFRVSELFGRHVVTTRTAIVWSGLFVALLGRSRLANFHKPAAEGSVPHGPLLARAGKLGAQIGKLGLE